MSFDSVHLDQDLKAHKTEFKPPTELQCTHMLNRQRVHTHTKAVIPCTKVNLIVSITLVATHQAHSYGESVWGQLVSCPLACAIRTVYTRI